MSTRTRTLLVATLLVTATMSAPASAAFFSDDQTPPIQQYAVGPSFVVTVEDGKLSSLQSWANSSENRQLIRTHNASNTATIAAPRSQVTGGLLAIFQTPLEKRGYVTAVHPNYILSNAEPVSVLANESSWTPPKEGRLQFDDPPYPTKGVAYDDVNSTRLGTANQTTGLDNTSATGAGQVVAVVDTGCNVAGGSAGVQGDLLNESASFLGDGRTTVNESGYTAVEDENGHGSWVTASITGSEGLAPDAQVLCLQALDKDGSGSVSDLSAAIRYAADSNASVDVLTMSLGSPVYSEALADAIAYAFNNSDIEAVTVAAGNSRQTTKFVATPADVKGVIGVAATTNEEPSSAESAYFSQVTGETAADTSLKGSDEVDVAAPGMKVTAPVPTTAGGTENRTLSGTSMATPLVAASIANALAANSTLAEQSHTEIEDAVQQSARPVPNAAVAEVGHGMVAGDNLATGTHPATSQAEARITAAQERDVYYDALAKSSGGLVEKYLKWRLN